MKRKLPLILSPLLASLPMLAVYAQTAATVPSTSPAAAVGSVRCRHVTTTDRGTTTAADYCGTPAQWAELDRRIALMQAGVTCRNARTASELCLTKEQWRRHDSKQQAGLWLDKSESDTSTNVNNSWSVGTGQMTDILLYTGN